MTDPNLIFTNQGKISLKDFREMYEIIEDDPELLEMARNTYGPKLQSISKTNDKNKSKIAEKFLRVLFNDRIPKTLEYISKEPESKEKNIAQEVLDNRGVIESSKILKSVATQMGYDLKTGSKEGLRVLDYEGNLITVIPNHKKINNNTSRGILKDLASGESSFRKKSA